MQWQHLSLCLHDWPHLWAPNPCNQKPASQWTHPKPNSSSLQKCSSFRVPNVTKHSHLNSCSNKKIENHPYMLRHLTYPGNYKTLSVLTLLNLSVSLSFLSLHHLPAGRQNNLPQWVSAFRFTHFQYVLPTVSKQWSSKPQNMITGNSHLKLFNGTSWPESKNQTG